MLLSNVPQHERNEASNFQHSGLKASNNEKTEHTNKDVEKIEVDAGKLQRRMRKYKRKNVKKRIKQRGMRFAKVSGNCCWEVREQYHGGESTELWRAHTYHLPWSIRSIKLIEC